MDIKTIGGRRAVRPLRVLVTGGAGFIGSHLCERLLSMGHAVCALDDFTTGSPENVAHLASDRRFTLIEHDVTQPFDLPVDRIYNLASPASAVHYERDPVRTTMINVLGTANALELAERHGASFVQASGNEVYGDPEVHPQPESYRGAVDPTGPRACYDEGKRCAESLVADFTRSRGVAGKIARIFCTYGPRMAIDDGRVVSTFIVQALRGEDLTVFGDGRQTRTFCYVDDLVSGLVALMEHQTECGPVNLGSTSEVEVRDLAEEILRLTGSRSSIVASPAAVDGAARRTPVVDRARAELGFEAVVPLEAGLARTIAWFDGALAREACNVRGAVATA